MSDFNLDEAIQQIKFDYSVYGDSFSPAIKRLIADVLEAVTPNALNMHEKSYKAQLEARAKELLTEQSPTKDETHYRCAKCFQYATNDGTAFAEHVSSCGQVSKGVA